jgi:quinol monooxygenase YgiN
LQEEKEEMIIRLVKMVFEPENIEEFQKLFHENKQYIRDFEGCSHLELYQDKSRPEIFFTYSYWENEKALENYRHSDLFKSVWGETKKLFGAKPEAWSVDKVVSLD